MNCLYSFLDKLFPGKVNRKEAINSNEIKNYGIKCSNSRIYSSTQSAHNTPLNKKSDIKSVFSLSSNESFTNLYAQEFSINRILNPSQMLTDNEIYSALKILENQFQHKTNLKGFFDPQSMNSKIFKKKRNQFYVNFFNDERFVQILHDGACHWFTISNIHSINMYQIQAYDSLYQDKTYIKNSQLKNSLKKILIPPIKLEMDEPLNNVLIECSIEPVQMQENFVMCGLFAIAFAYDLCRGMIDPTRQKYDAEKMREHLLKCLSQNYFEEFPQLPRHEPTHKVKDQIIFIDLS